MEGWAALREVSEHFCIDDLVACGRMTWTAGDDDEEEYHGFDPVTFGEYEVRATGWLAKKEGISSKWTEYWAILTSEELRTYKKDEAEKCGFQDLGIVLQTKPHGAVSMKACATVQNSTAPNAETNELELITDERTYRLKATGTYDAFERDCHNTPEEKQTECDKWIQQINHLITFFQDKGEEDE